MFISFIFLFRNVFSGVFIVFVILWLKIGSVFLVLSWIVCLMFFIDVMMLFIFVFVLKCLVWIMVVLLVFFSFFFVNFSFFCEIFIVFVWSLIVNSNVKNVKKEIRVFIVLLMKVLNFDYFLWLVESLLWNIMKYVNSMVIVMIIVILNIVKRLFFKECFFWMLVMIIFFCCLRSGWIIVCEIVVFESVWKFIVFGY